MAEQNERRDSKIIEGASGAAIGALVGTVLGPVGSMAGAVAGTILGPKYLTNVVDKVTDRFGINRR